MLANRHSPTPVVVILTAAGEGARLGYDKPKALVKVGSETILKRSVRAFLDFSGVTFQLQGIVVTAPGKLMERFSDELAEARETVPVHVVSGGETRQQSVFAGLRAWKGLSDGQVTENTCVLVHDAARVLTPSQMVERVAQAVVAGAQSVVPGLAVTDTIRQVEDAVGVEDLSARLREIGAEDAGVTLCRDRLRAVQTPQGFPWEVIWEAHSRAAEAGAVDFSDDAGLVEHYGAKTVVVPGDPMAFKVTTRLDLALAELLGG